MSAFDWLDDESEELQFYGGEETLFYDDKEHSYYKFENDAIRYIPGVTSACGIVDKSAALMQWAANLSVDYISAQIDAANADCRCGNFAGDLVKSWLDKARFAHRDYKENAADIGHIAHGWLEKFIKICIRTGRLIQPDECGLYPENERARNGCIAAIDWMRRHRVKWVYTERKIYSRRYDYAGTMDGLAHISSCGDAECCGHWVKKEGRWVREALDFENILAVIDWKTSNQLHTSYHWQTAAYMQAIEEEIGRTSKHPVLTEPIIYRIVARLGKDDAQFEARLLPPETAERDFDTFLSTRDTYLRVKAEEEEERQLKKAVREQDKDDRINLKCAKADKYKGIKGPPRCNGTDHPCAACMEKYLANHSQEQAA